MRRFVTLVILAAVAAAFQVTARADDGIYQAFGQKAGIHALVEDFVARLQADPRTSPFFAHANTPRLIEQLTDQFCQESGGPCQYGGVPMGPRHAGMNIGKSDFDALVEVLQQAMDAKGIPFSAQNGLLARLAPMHRDIITRH